jgi:hypothetical protein
MKKLMTLLVGLTMVFSLTSCVTTAQAQMIDEGIGATLVIRYGTPYYNAEGLLLYFFYNDMYYYPYYFNDGWYFRYYRRPLSSWYYRPVPRGFYTRRPYHTPHVHHATPPRGGHHGINQPHHGTHQPSHGNRLPQSQHRHGTYNNGTRPHVGMGNSRPASPMRSSTRDGHFGGRR